MFESLITRFSQHSLVYCTLNIYNYRQYACDVVTAMVVYHQKRLLVWFSCCVEHAPTWPRTIVMQIPRDWMQALH